MKTDIIKNPAINVKTTDRNIINHYSIWLATEIYNQFSRNNVPMKLLNYVDKKKRNIIMLQSEIIKIFEMVFL